jgi:hypothetical protein
MHLGHKKDKDPESERHNNSVGKLKEKQNIIVANRPRTNLIIWDILIGLVWEMGRGVSRQNCEWARGREPPPPF